MLKSESIKKQKLIDPKQKMFNNVLKYFKKVQIDSQRQFFPLISSTLIASTIGITYYGKKNKKSTIIENFKEGIKKIYNKTFVEDTIPTLPNQKENKPLFIFDIDDFLVCKKFSLFKLDNIILKRPYTQTFLFHMAHFYELILITEHDSFEGSKILEKVDPYGCINYRFFIKNKKKFLHTNLNRNLNQTIIINDALPKSFENNKVYIEKWDGRKDNKLLDLLSFCTNMAILDIKDYRNTVKSYKGKDFFNAFNSTQKKIFKERNMFTWNYDKKYNEKVNEINKERIETFENAKISMDQQILKDRMYDRKIDLFTKVQNILLNLFI